MAYEAVRTAGDGLMVAIALEADDGGEEAVRTHGPEHQAHRRGVTGQTRDAQPGWDRVAPVKPAEIEPGEHPRENKKRDDQRAVMVVHAAFSARLLALTEQIGRKRDRREEDAGEHDRQPCPD